MRQFRSDEEIATAATADSNTDLKPVDARTCSVHVSPAREEGKNKVSPDRITDQYGDLESYGQMNLGWLRLRTVKPGEVPFCPLIFAGESEREPSDCGSSPDAHGNCSNSTCAMRIAKVDDRGARLWPHGRPDYLALDLTRVRRVCLTTGGFSHARGTHRQ